MKVKLLNLDNNQKLIKLLQDNKIDFEFISGPKPLGLIIFCGFFNYQLDNCLAILKKEKIDIPLKCIETSDNKNWPIEKLYFELVKEYMQYNQMRVK